MSQKSIYEEVASLIKKRRKELHYSREQLTEITRVPLSFINAIEEGDDSGLPEPVYCRGFLRTIGKTLGIEAVVPAVSDINLQTHVPPPLMATKKTNA